MTRAFEQAIERRGLPESIRCDNGPELTSRHFLGWCEERKIQLINIQPGRPMQTGHVESFNGRLRDECLNASWFRNLADAREKISRWQADYKTKAASAIYSEIPPTSNATTSLSLRPVSVCHSFEGQSGSMQGRSTSISRLSARI